MSASQLLKHFKESGMTPGKYLPRVVLVCAPMSVVAAAPNNNQQQPAQKTPLDVLPAQTTPNNSEADKLRKRVRQLTAELTRLKKRVTELEKVRRVDAIQDRLGKEQQRAETLHAQLLATMEKESALQARVSKIDEQLRPENIDRSLAGVGSLHPEDARDLRIH